jgi:hypothetical protein
MQPMFLLRYFIVTGGILLGLLFLAGWYLPPSTAIDRADIDIDRTILRLHSDHKWSDAITMDTSLAIRAPAKLVEDEVSAAPATPIRQAYAYVPLPPQKTPEKLRRRVRSSNTRRNPTQQLTTYQPWDWLDMTVDTSKPAASASRLQFGEHHLERAADGD